MLLYLLPESYEQIHWPISPERFLFSRLPSMFVFSLEGPRHPTRTAVTGNAFTELALQVMSVEFVLYTVDFFTLFLWLVYSAAIWSSEFSLSFFSPD